MAKRQNNSEPPGTTAANVGYDAKLWQMAPPPSNEALCLREIGQGGSATNTHQYEETTTWKH